MAKPKPEIPSFAKDVRVPKVGNVCRPEKWRFSFQYWRQIENFGLNGQDPSWFVSLLERLCQLSAESEDALDLDFGKREFYRYHAINWQQEGIPIQRKHLQWLPPEYLENDAEYPIYQFTISTALGRVVGFHDENGVFQIILLDPKHNLQPAKSFDYRVDSCWPLGNQYEQILGNLRDAQQRAQACSDPHCIAKHLLARLESDFQPRSVIYVPDEVILEAEKLRSSGRIKSLEELFEINVISKA